MGAWFSQLFGGGRPILEMDPHDNKIQCCVENISHSSSDSTQTQISPRTALEAMHAIHPLKIPD